MDKPEFVVRIAQLERINSLLWIALGAGVIGLAGLAIVAFPKHPKAPDDAAPTVARHAVPLAALKDFVDEEPIGEPERNYQAIQQLYRSHLLTPEERAAKVKLLRAAPSDDDTPSGDIEMTPKVRVSRVESEPPTRRKAIQLRD